MLNQKYADDNDKGGMRVWCSSCNHSAHTMFKIAKWWVNLNLIKFEKLSSYPDLKLTATTASYYNGAHSGIKEVEIHRKNLHKTNTSTAPGGIRSACFLSAVTGC